MESTPQGALIHNKLVITDEAIIFRQATDGATMQIDLKEIALAERRINEIQSVTPSKAPELLSAFTIAWRDLDKLVTILTYQHVIASNRLKDARSRILIDEVPAIIEQKGLPSSKDVRDAIIDRHPDVQELQETAHQIHCILELVKGKKEAIGMAFSSVKRIVGEGAYNMLRNTKNSNLSGDTGVGSIEQSPALERTPISRAPSTATNRFGQPRY